MSDVNMGILTIQKIFKTMTLGRVTKGMQIGNE